MGKPQSTVPPWHLWGGLEIVETPVETVGALRFGNEQQLCKVGYGRPDTWHWIFCARLISGPANSVGFFTRIFVHFDVTIGMGRAATPIHFVTPTGGFENFVFIWTDPNPFPAGLITISTESIAGPRDRQTPEPDVLLPIIRQLPAESIQVKARVVALTAVGNVAAVGQPVRVECSSYWTPKSHIRPDWFETEPVFAGGETEGR